MALKHADSPVSIPYSTDFEIFFLCDEGELYSYILNKDLQQKGITLKALLELGIQNLTSIAQNIEITTHEEILYFTGSGYFEASLLLVPEIWDEWLAEHCPNGYVAAIPTRDILVVHDSNNLEGKRKLTEIIEKVWPDGDHLLSKSLFMRKNNKWMKYE